MLQYTAGCKFVDGGVHVQVVDFPDERLVCHFAVGQLALDRLNSFWSDPGIV